MRRPFRPRGPQVALVVLTPDQEELRAQVMTLAPALEQERYSGRAKETLPWADTRPRMTPFAIVVGPDAVGFGILDTAELDLAPLTEQPGSAVLLRSFYVDAQHQGHHYGLAAARAVPSLAERVAPRAVELLLTVNVGNKVALDTYLAAGWTDTGEQFLGGTLGPQRILRHPLRPRLP